LSHDAGSVPGLDRIAFAGELGQLDLLDIFPVRRLDRNGEPLHSAHDRTIALGSCRAYRTRQRPALPRKLLAAVVRKLVAALRRS
jgi:hypothetical protein